MSTSSSLHDSNVVKTKDTITATSVPADQDSDKNLNRDDGWDFKLATLFSIFESTSEDVLQRALVDAKGDLEQAIPLILSSNTVNDNQTSSPPSPPHSSTSAFSRTNSLESVNSSNGDYPKRKKQKLVQPRLSEFLHIPTSSSLKTTSSSTKQSSTLTTTLDSDHHGDPITNATKESSTPLPSLNDRLRWKEGSDETSSSSSHKPPKPLVLYNPEDVAKHCPCTLVFNVLEKDLATRLLQAMLVDSETWNRNRWWLFERMVESPHKTSYFAERDDDMEEVSGWTYNGMKQDQPRRFLPEMTEAKFVVRRIVNELRKTRDIHPYEVQGDWNCNVAAVNHYAHSKESVGWHADKLTYLGPRPTIGSLTLGATRFFRIRKIIPDAKRPDTAGQLISTDAQIKKQQQQQEEWKHEIPPQATVTPHPISGTARINITFRLRRDGFSPADTPVCKCGVAMVLRCVFKNRANYGKYFYMCYAGGSQEGRTCGAFQWVDMEEKFKLRDKIKHEEGEDTQASEKADVENEAGLLGIEGAIKSTKEEEENEKDPIEAEAKDLDLNDELDDGYLDNWPLLEVDETEKGE
ncbi:hypothetical protein BGZ76_002464 [Entomortierella beljakovae]|nr:hypothetical protein BGZ76_002464 [Entomortierella beljakovae]